MSYIESKDVKNFKKTTSDVQEGWVTEQEIPVRAGETFENFIQRLVAYRDENIPVYGFFNKKKYSSQDQISIKEHINIVKKHKPEIEKFIKDNEIKNKGVKLSDLEPWEQNLYRISKYKYSNFKSANFYKETSVRDDARETCDTLNEFADVYGTIDERR